MSADGGPRRDEGKGWRSPRVAKFKQEHDDALASQRSRRQFLRRIGIGATVIAAAAGSASAGAFLSPQGRRTLASTLAGLREVAPGQGLLAAGPTPAAPALLDLNRAPQLGMAAGIRTLDDLDVPGFNAGAGLGPEARAGGFVKKPQTRPNGVEGSGRFEGPPNAAEQGVGDASAEPQAPTGPERTPVANRATGQRASGDLQAGDELQPSPALGISDGGAWESTPPAQGATQAELGGDSAGLSEAGLLPPPTPIPTPDPRLVNPFGSDSTRPTPTPDAGVLAPNIPSYNLPKGSRVSISKLRVEAPVVAVGIDRNGRMLAPSSPKEVGWFELGPLPGAFGNAILTGHVDWNDGRLGVFASLKKLAAGDLVEFKNPNTGSARFEVKWQKTYVASKAPIAEILAQNLKEHELTLITCAGTFDRRARNYSHRLVVRCGMK